MIRLAKRYGRYGYKRVTALLRNDGWHVNHKRIERLWKREGLKVPLRDGGHSTNHRQGKHHFVARPWDASQL